MNAGMKIVYADNAATTQISPEAALQVQKWLSGRYGNPSSIYGPGREANAAVQTARQQVAFALGAEAEEIYFTGSGTESDNWAVKGAAFSGARSKKKHIIISAYEHHAVLNTARSLKKDGFEVTEIPPDSEGIIHPERVREALRSDTALVSIMYANNEIGTINPVAKIGAVCREAGVLFHSDAVQAAGHIHIDVLRDNVDMLSISGHKFNAPKGVGALYIKKGVRITNLLDGGHQERGRRAGTENVAFICAMGAALESAVNEIDSETARLRSLGGILADGLLALPGTRLNGSRESRLAGNLNISFSGIEGESLLLWLDIEGICASSGSACTSRSLEPSHVLLSIGLDHETAHGSLRLSLGKYSVPEDVDYILQKLPPIVKKLREMSPLWNQSP